MTVSSAPSRKSFDPRLSSLRGLGATWVTASHVVEMGALPLSAAASVLISGYLGVALFFVLSIYLILRTLDVDSDLKRYFKRRALRIWPLYWATVIAVFLLWQHSAPKLLANLAFVAIWMPKMDYGYTFWSLQVEELAYLAFPLIHALKPASQVWLAWGMIAFSAAWTVLAHWPTPLRPGWLWDCYELPFPWVGVYGWGLLAYRGRIPDLGRLWPLLLVPALLVVPQTTDWDVAILVLGPVFAALVAHPPRALDAVALVLVGEISYALYLEHQEMIEAWGWVGLLLAVPLAAASELLARGRQIRGRIRSLALSPAPEVA